MLLIDLLDSSFLYESINSTDSWQQLVFFFQNKEERHSQPQTQQAENYVPEKKVAPSPQDAMVFHNCYVFDRKRNQLKRHWTGVSLLRKLSNFLTGMYEGWGDWRKLHMSTSDHLIDICIHIYAHMYTHAIYVHSNMHTHHASKKYAI